MKTYEIVGAGVSAVVVAALGLGLVFGMPGSDGDKAKTDAAPPSAPAVEKAAPVAPGAPAAAPVVAIPAAPVSAPEPATASQLPAPAGSSAPAASTGAGTPADAKSFLEQAAPIIEALTGGGSGGAGTGSSLTPESLLEQLKNPTALPGGLSGLPIPR